MNCAERLVAVAVDKKRGSKEALKWALDNVLTRGQIVRLVHVDPTHQLPAHVPSPCDSDTMLTREPCHRSTDFFLPFRCFCSRREIQWEAVTLEEQDVAKALIDFTCLNRIDTLVLGAPSKSGISRLFKIDIPSIVLKGAPYFCNVYVISKGRVASARAATHPISTMSTLRRRSPQNLRVHIDVDSIDRASNTRMHDEWSIMEPDRLSFTSPGRLSTDSSIFSFYNNLGSEPAQQPPRSLSVSGQSFDPLGSKSKLSDIDTPSELLSPLEKEGIVMSSAVPDNQEIEEKMKRLELQVKQTMEMYHAACKEALTAKHKAREFQLLKIENDKRLVEAEKAKQELMASSEEEKDKCRIAYKLAKAAYRKAEKERQNRMSAETKALEEAEHKKMMVESISQYHALVLRQQSLLHILVVFFFFYVYFF